MQASLNNYRQSPRKVRLVTDLIKGRSVPAALEQLNFLPKRASAPLAKLLKSAVANAGNGPTRMAEQDLLVKNVRVDEGVTMKRFRPRARGSASRINKRTSQIQITLEAKPLKAKS